VKRSSPIRSLTIGLVLLLGVAGCRSTTAAPSTRRACPTSAPAIALRAAPAAEEISVEQLVLLLPRRPIVVGFDVDDTLVFSAPAFNALQPQYDPAVIRPRDYQQLTPAQRAKYHEFWDRLNDDFDDRSTPKAIGKRLLDLHRRRGDTIYIISKRQSSTRGTDRCTPRYERMFEMKFAHPVVQTQLRDKTPFICERGIEYYYGDADGDITASLAAGAVPIRVQRGADSYAKDAVHNGLLGEIVIRDSTR
jgi:acid phosphatase (class B)